MEKTTDIGFVSAKQLRDNWKWFLGLGIALVILGTLAVIYACTATLFSVLYLGALLVVVGIAEIIHAFKLRTWGNFLLHLFLGIIYGVGGGYILLYPGVNILTLTLLLAAFLVATGVARIIFALTQRVPHPVWLTINGFLSIILGLLIWRQWPAASCWVIGMFVGIDAIFTGWTWIMLSSIAKNTKTDVVVVKTEINN